MTRPAPGAGARRPEDRSARRRPRRPRRPPPGRPRPGRRWAGVGPRLLRAALARGRLPLGALRLTLLRAVDDALRARGVPAEDRRARLGRVGRFLADHAHRRRPPSAGEVRRWARELVRRGRASEAEAAACLRAVALLYARVLGRWPEKPAPGSRTSGPASSRPSHRGPITGPPRREDGRGQ